LWACKARSNPCDQDLGVLISKSYINNYIVMGAENSRFEEQVAKADCECPLYFMLRRACVNCNEYYVERIDDHE